MAQPAADRVDVHPGSQQMRRGRVSNDMWADLLVRENQKAAAPNSTSFYSVQDIQLVSPSRRLCHESPSAQCFTSFHPSGVRSGTHSWPSNLIRDESTRAAQPAGRIRHHPPPHFV